MGKNNNTPNVNYSIHFYVYYYVYEYHKNISSNNYHQDFSDIIISSTNIFNIHVNCFRTLVYHFNLIYLYFVLTYNNNEINTNWV